MKSFSNAGATNRHMFWSQPNPCAKTIARSPAPRTCTLFRYAVPVTHSSPENAREMSGAAVRVPVRISPRAPGLRPSLSRSRRPTPRRCRRCGFSHFRSRESVHRASTAAPACRGSASPGSEKPRNAEVIRIISSDSSIPMASSKSWRPAASRRGTAPPHVALLAAMRSMRSAISLLFIGWALGTLIEQGAVMECEHHGHRRDRADPDAWNRAREEAWRNPFPGATPEACIAAMDEVMRSIGDTCPDC